MSEMTEYELINPSDAVYFDAPEPVVAACAAALVGEGAYDAKGPEGSVGGLLLFGMQPFTSRYGDFGVAMEQHRDAIKAALRSFRIKGKRSSLNDIVRRAKILAGETAEVTP